MSVGGILTEGPGLVLSSHPQLGQLLCYNLLYNPLKKPQNPEFYV